MKTLYLLRHAKSSWKQAGISDHDRPLNKRGKQDAPRMGAFMRDRDLIPQLILCSSAKRARQTADRIVDTSGYSGEIIIRDALYSFDAAAYLKALAALNENWQSVMLVGHNPAMGELLEELSGSFERYPTAALAKIRLPIESWAEIGEWTQGELLGFWYPKGLPEGYN